MSTLVNKLTLLIAVLLVFGALAWGWHHKTETINDLKVVTKSQTAVIKEQKAVIKDTTEVAKIDEAANLEVVVTASKIAKTQDGIIKKVRAKVSQVVHTYGLKPKSVENTHEQDETLSEIRITGLWEAYCAGVPNAKECPAPAPSDKMSAAVTLTPSV